jgi:hypothetical protein
MRSRAERVEERSKTASKSRVGVVAAHVTAHAAAATVQPAITMSRPSDEPGGSLEALSV